MTDHDGIITPDDILRLAQQDTGLTEIDSDTWRPGLTILLEELNNSSVVTPSGRAQQIKNWAKALGTRLTVHDYVTKHPEVLDEKIERPLVVLGMPRTGTTVISYLLDKDPRRRSLLKWEAEHPVPPPTTETRRTDPRCLAMLEEERNIVAFIKDAGMPLPHWEDADGPTEDMFLHNHDFKALAWDSWSPTSRYATWLIDEADMTSTYEYQKLVMQILQSTAPGTWSIKMPSHSVHIEALLKVFPDARLVWAHRDPYKATGSLCNLWMLPQSMAMNKADIDREELGRNAVKQMTAHVNNPLRARDRIGDEQFFHMYYADMMREPMAVMRKLYAWAGDELSPEVEAGMVRWLDEHPQNLFAPNKYTLDEYGLSVEQLEPIFAEYLATFDIEPEGRS
jgi:Sulfotransferase family